MPYIMVFSTIGFMFGTGGSAIVAKTLGERKREKANDYFSLFVYAALALGILFAAIGIVFVWSLRDGAGETPCGTVCRI